MVAGPLGRRFWILWASFSTANLGDGLTYVAFPLLAVHLTDDARLVTLVAAARFLPFVVVGLPAGMIIDRFDRRRLAVGSQLVRGTVLGGLAAGVVAEEVTIASASAAAFVLGLGEVLTDGGLPAVVRSVVRVDQLEVANSRLSVSQTVTNYFIGPPVGGFLFAWSPALPFLAAAGVFVAAALALLGLPGRFKPELSGGDSAESGDDHPLRAFWSELTVGIRYVWNHRVLRPLALSVAVFAFSGEAANAVLVLLVRERLGLADSWFGILLTIDASASLLTALVMARLVGRVGHANSMRISVVTYATACVLLATVTPLALVMLALAVWGVSDPTWNVVSSTVRQRLVPDEVFGRMMTAYLTIAWSLQPLGAMAGGAVAEAWGPEWVYLGSGLLVLSLLVLGRPMFARVTQAMVPTPDPVHPVR